MKRKKIVVLGFMGCIPIAGVIWQHIHYIVGLLRLGHDVYYSEDTARLPYNPKTGEVTDDFSYAAKLLVRLADEFGFKNKWRYSAPYLEGGQGAGLSRKVMLQHYREADAILNVCGAHEMNEDLATSERLIYVESDPGLEQIKIDQGDRATMKHMRDHHALFTFGENVGTKKFPVPARRLKWLPTRQPVVTDFWKTSASPKRGAVFTSVANWSTSGLKDISWRGEKYLWSKSREFLRFVAAPKKAGEEFELATNITDAPTRAKFEKNGWRFQCPDELSINHRSYRDYIRRSKGEFTVAKDQYVRLNTGWFSDRSACYLAAGRPVITQETGFTEHYGKSEGLFAFHSLGEIAEAVKMINADYGKHSRAARALACEAFEAEKVLHSLLQRAGI